MRCNNKGIFDHLALHKLIYMHTQLACMYVCVLNGKNSTFDVFPFVIILQ